MVVPQLRNQTGPVDKQAHVGACGVDLEDIERRIGTSLRASRAAEQQ
jgi:hypothetical protein